MNRFSHLALFGLSTLTLMACSAPRRRRRRPERPILDRKSSI
jgi:hypothetical protein